jgi:hypothetical protein
MFFALELALAALPELGERSVSALEGLLPGGVTLLLPNPARRFPLACGPDPETLGLRVPALPPAAHALHAVRWPVLQSSANRAGGPDARRLEDVDAGVRARVDVVLDGGELPGTPSTVVDLTGFERDGAFEIVREDEWYGLAPEIRLWEPRMALVSGPDGLSAIRSLTAGAPSGTRLALEHAPDQGDAVAALLTGAETLRDLSGRPRVTVGTRA